MIDQNSLQSPSKTETAGTQTRQVSIRMQQGEQTGQPLYSNFASVHGGQNVVIVDFGFLEPQTIQALNKMSQSGEQVPESVTARMSCRIALSVEAANNLAQQMNQLLPRK